MTKTSEKQPKKRSIGRLILKIMLWLVALLIAAIVAVYIYLGAIVKGAITRFVPPITGTTVEVADVDLSLLSGRVGINGLKIGNPAGYSSNSIFELGQIDVAFQPKTVLTDKIIIDSVIISGTKVSAELKNLYSLDSNVGDLQKNIENYLGAPAPKKAEKKPVADDSVKGGKKVVIKDLQIKNTELAVGASGATVSLPLPDIHQKNIGEAKKEKTIAEVMADILDMISVESLKGVANSAKDLAKQGAQMAKDLAKQGVDGAKDLVSSGTNAVKDGAKGAVDGIKGLFK